MRLVGRARAIAAVAGAIGVGLMLFDAWSAGFALLTVAAAVGFLVTDRAFPETLPDRAVDGSARALAEIVQALNLRGRGILVPGATSADAELVQALNLRGRGILVPGATSADASRVFVPASASPDEARDVAFEDAPAAWTGRVLVKDGPGARGAFLTAPGAGLEAEWRAVNGLPTGKGVEEAAWHVRRAFRALGVGADVTLARSGGVVRVSFTPLAFPLAGRAARDALAPWHVQGADPAASFAGILVARALDAPVRFVDAGEDGGRQWVDLEIGPARSRPRAEEVAARTNA